MTSKRCRPPSKNMVSSTKASELAIVIFHRVRMSNECSLQKRRSRSAYHVASPACSVRAFCNRVPHARPVTQSLRVRQFRRLGSYCSACKPFVHHKEQFVGLWCQVVLHSLLGWLCVLSSLSYCPCNVCSCVYRYPRPLTHWSAPSPPSWPSWLRLRLLSWLLVPRAPLSPFRCLYSTSACLLRNSKVQFFVGGLCGLSGTEC